MTTPEANPRLNVSVPLTGAPTGDFAITAMSVGPSPVRGGAAIVAEASVPTVGSAVVNPASKFLNLDVPCGEISAVPDACVKADGELSFSVSGAARATPAAAIATAKVDGAAADTAASLNLGSPKFSY
jgi:hypothetical protein